MYYEQIHNNNNEFLTHLNSVMTSNGWVLIDNTNNKRVYDGNGVVIIFQLGFCGSRDGDASSNSEWSNYRQIRINVLEEGNYNTNLQNIFLNTTGLDDNDVYSGWPGFLIEESKKSKSFISVNENRFLMVFQQNGVYQSMYAGKYLSYASPLQHPNPHCYIGNIVNANCLTSGNKESSILRMGSVQGDTENGDCYVKRWDGYWNRIRYGSGYGGRFSGIYPFFEGCDREFYPNLDGSYTAIPSVIITDYNSSDDNSEGYLLGELEGVFGVSGTYNSPENDFTYNLDDYICFPSLRLEYKNMSYFAIKKA